MSLYRVVADAASALCPTGAEIVVDDDGPAFLILGGIRAVRADSLRALLAQLDLSERDVERTGADDASL